MNATEICDFYDQRSILITGSTGFLGKVLVEKLLRSVPSLKRVFLLIRPCPKNNTSAKHRLDGLLHSQLFSILKEKSPHVFEKVVAVDGNLTDENLGLNENDAKILLNEVSIVFHCAATVKFDEALRVSVDMNVSGTQRLLQFCRKMKNITVFVHASTAYANCDRSHILESVYTPPMQPEKLVEALSWMDDRMVASLTPLLVGQRPNTYTYTKALAEYIVNQEAAHLPVAIVRPSIIGAIWNEPLPGWTDNLNGPTGLFASIGKGLLRSMIGDSNATADIVPVDVVSNVLIVTAWHRANETSESCPVINCCTSRLNSLKWGDIVEAMKFFDQYPLEDIFRVPKPHFTMNNYWRETMVFFDHLLPAYLTDFCFRLFGHKPKLIRIYKKLFRAVNTLEYFTSRQWHFQSKMIVNLYNDLSPQDKKTLRNLNPIPLEKHSDNFNIDVTQIDWERYLENYVIGVKRYILKEQMSNILKARLQLKRKKTVSTVFDLIFGFIVFKFLIKRYPKLFNRFWFYILSIVMAFHRIRPDGKPRIPKNNFASMNLNNNAAILARSDFDCSEMSSASPSSIEETKRKNKNASASSWINQFIGSQNLE